LRPAKPYGLTVLDTSCVLSSLDSDCLSITVESRSPIGSVAWSADGGQVFFVTKVGGVAALNLADRKVEIADELRGPAREWSDRITLRGTFPQTTAQEFRAWLAHELKRALPPDDPIVKDIGVTQTGVESVVSLDRDLGIVVHAGGRAWRPGLLDPWADDDQFISTPAPGALVFGGRVSSQAGAPSPGPSGVEDSYRPVIDDVTGDLVGIAGERGVTLSGDPAGVAAGAIGQLAQAQPDLTLIGASVNGGRGLLAALTESVGSGKALRLISMSTGRVSTLPLGGAVEGVQDVTLRLLDLGTAARPLPARLYSRPNATGLAVVFHGGPGNNASRDSYVRSALPYLKQGLDVLVPETSASTGYGPALAARVRSEGPGALVVQGEEDVISPPADTANLRGASRIIIPGRTHDSLGATPQVITWLFGRPPPAPTPVVRRMPPA